MSRRRVALKARPAPLPRQRGRAVNVAKRAARRRRASMFYSCERKRKCPVGDDHAAPTTAKRWTGHGFNPGTRCLSSFRALTTHAQSHHGRRGEMGTYANNSTAKIAHLGARASYRRSVWIYRPDRRRTRLSRRLFSRLDRVGHGLAPLSFLAPHTERIYG